MAFLSRALGPRTRGLSTYEKESLVILLAVDYWRPYLQHAEFVIMSDQKSLSFLTEQTASTPWQQKTLTKLAGLRYRILYKKGAENRAADALSRRLGTDQGELNAVSMSVPVWLNEVMGSYAADPDTQSTMAALSISGSKVPGYGLRDGILHYKNCIWVGKSPELHQCILHSLHASPAGGHSGINATYQRVKSLFAWTGLKGDVTRFISSCDICQRAKVEHVKYPGLLEPLPVPDHAWQMVSLDFIEGLLKSNKFNAILVVVDKFSKYAHFIPLSHLFTALQVAQAYMQEVFRLHSMPQSIISDRDRIFTSTFWQELFRLSHTQLRMSSSYHPQTDGQTERVNHCRCFVHACPSKWSQWLAFAEYWYNTPHHSALGKSPFEVLYGHAPRHFGITSTPVCSSGDLTQYLAERQDMTQLVRHHLLRAQQRMKAQADRNRSERHFEVGDWVYFKLHPYIQRSVATRMNQKLSLHYYGPYKIIGKVGKVSYRLELPESSKIHSVVHVSLLKEARGYTSTSPPIPLPVIQDPDCPVQPLEVVDERMVRKGNKTVRQVKVRWTNADPEASTWENPEELQRVKMDASS